MVPKELQGMTINEVPIVKFQNEDPRYTMTDMQGGVWPVPSVTELLEEERLSQDFGAVPKIDMDWYKDRGTKIDKACNLWDEDNLDPETLDPRIRGYLDSYILAKEKYGFKILLSQKMVVHKDALFAGTLDKLVMFDRDPETFHTFENEGTIAVVDLKSGQPHISHGYQLAGYHDGLVCEFPELTSIKRYGLYLRKDGALPKFVEYAEQNDYNVFRSALICFHARNRRIKNWKRPIRI